jgi:hypothetical protein
VWDGAVLRLFRDHPEFFVGGGEGLEDGFALNEIRCLSLTGLGRGRLSTESASASKSTTAAKSTPAAELSSAATASTETTGGRKLVLVRVGFRAIGLS